MSLANHSALRSLNIFNNQGFTPNLMTDLREFIFKGKNKISHLSFAHCNLDPSSLNFLFRNLKYAKYIRSLDVSMMHFNAEVIISLSMALQNYKGNRVLDYLNIGYNHIRNEGTLLILNYRIRSINISRSTHLEFKEYQNK